MTADTISDYIWDNLFNMFGTVLAYGLGAFALAIMLLVVLKRYNWLKRNNAIFKVLVILWAVLVPVSWAICGAAWGVTSGAKSLFVTQVDATIELMQDAFEESFFNQFAGFVSDNYNALMGYSSTEEVIDEFLNNHPNVAEAGNLSGEILGYALEYAADAAAGKVAGATGAEEETVEAALGALVAGDLLEMEQQVWNGAREVGHAQVAAVFAPFFSLILLWFVFLSALPALEIGINGYRSRRQLSLAAQAQNIE